MNLYIETENGSIKNHPAFEDNILQAFGVIPAHWEPFERVPEPALGVYELLAEDRPVYEKVNGVWSDVWLVRNMTTEEKTAKQQAVITAFSEREYASNWLAWTFDEAICKMVPPIPRPILDQAKVDAGLYVFWCGAENNWREASAYPDPSKRYKFDFFAWQWVEITE
jgi:hypothetical protein